MKWFDDYVYMRPKYAASHGMTNYGWYYFVPIYIGGWDREEGPIVGARIPITDFIMEYVLHPMEGLLNTMLDREPLFMFKVGEPTQG